MTTETIWWSEHPTDLGTFGIASTVAGLLALFLPSEMPRHEAALQRLLRTGTIVPDDGRNQPVAKQLDAYLGGARRVFDLRLDLRGTPFQLAVWRAVAEVPWGETASYGEIAARIGKSPGASRAVGAANGANPIPVIIPCHRIVGSDGTLTGYGGGLPLKRALLEREGFHLAETAAGWGTLSLPM
jgi:O-6-methylguanine DNA methyltransferase